MGVVRSEMLLPIIILMSERYNVMALFDTTAFRILEQGAAVMWQKQQIIQQNISNQDTPKYNCKYLDFGGILRDKLRADGTVKKELNLATRVYIDKSTSDQGDRNNVDNDVQQAEMLKTQYQLDAIINQMNSSFTRVRSAMVTK